MSESFLADVRAGLSSSPKSLPSKYFYDAAGDALFVQIMALPEYYLTRAEMEIFASQANDIVSAFDQDTNVPFEVIELGAGDGSKTVHLLRALLEQDYDFDYIPVDISANAMRGLERDLRRELPGININPKAGDYFAMLGELRATKHPKIILFLGSNIGNLLDQEAAQFMSGLAANLVPGDKLLLGVDSIKSAEIVLPAYNDKSGITRQFNLNLLRRINRELGGNFDVTKFEHCAEYDSNEGIARSFLVSQCDQVVTLEGANTQYSFVQGERMKVEISRKYDVKILGNILRGTGFDIVDSFSDTTQYFTDYLLEIVS